MITFLLAYKLGDFTQRLHHFDPHETRMFNQQLFINSSFCNNGTFSKIVFTLCGNSFINSQNPFPPAAVRLAKENNALLLGVERRFSGNSSINFGDSSLKNLSFLTVEQILADYAAILKSFNKKCINKTCRTIIIGSGDSADYAAWFRLKYPQFTVGAWSSFGITDTPPANADFDANVIKRLQKCSQKCYENTRDILNLLHAGLTGSIDKRHEIQDMFDITYSTTAESSLYMIAEIFGLFDDMKYNGDDYFTAYCNQIESSATIQSFADFFRRTLINSGLNTTTFNPEAAIENPDAPEIQPLRNTWFLNCYQIGRFHITNGLRAPELGINFFTVLCGRMFEWVNTTGIEAARIELGGREFLGTSALFTRSTGDLNFGVMPSAAPERDVSVVEVEGVYEGFDLMDPDNNEAPEVTRGRQIAFDIANSWLNNSCERSCMHGRCLAGRCVCERDYGGEHCDSLLIAMGPFTTVKSLSIVGPTLIFAALSVIGWYVVFARRQTTLPRIIS